MLYSPINALKSEAETTTNCVVRLFHIWCRATALGANPLPKMVDCLSGLDDMPDLAPACESYFILAQACLERPLQPSEENAADLSSDEVVLIEMLRYASNPGANGANSALSQGLPGALRWAAFAVARSLGNAKDDRGAGLFLFLQDEEESDPVDGRSDEDIADG